MRVASPSDIQLHNTIIYNYYDACTIAYCPSRRSGAKRNQIKKISYGYILIGSRLYVGRHFFVLASIDGDSFHKRVELCPRSR
jgi:hypothetical protein